MLHLVDIRTPTWHGLLQPIEIINWRYTLVNFDNESCTFFKALCLQGKNLTMRT